jgi:pimeloyl-ACP methyl ester carboxylesterase
MELLRERLPSFVVETVPGAGHFVFEENPPALVEAVNRAHESARRSAAVARK